MWQRKENRLIRSLLVRARVLVPVLLASAMLSMVQAAPGHVHFNQSGRLSPTLTPGQRIILPGRFEVEDYRRGGPDVGYADTTPGNSGNAYRPDDVDIQRTTDSSGSFNVGWIAPGEWLAYDVDVQTSDRYVFRIRAATPHSGKRVHLQIDGVDVSGPLPLPNTGDYQVWADVISAPIPLTAGPHVLQLVADTGDVNLNYVVVSRAGARAPSPFGTSLLSPTAPAATVETAPVPQAGDAADDAAIWVHPEDAAKSTIIGTSKQGGLAVYDLAGNEVQYLADGNMNNVDLRDHFPLGGDAVTLVAATNRSINTIALYRVDPVTRRLHNVAARDVRPTVTAYGLCLYRSPRTGNVSVFVTSRSGEVEQWELFDNGQGRIDGRLVRQYALGSTTEGCVADDPLAHLYLGEEGIGIWKYGAEPDDATTPMLVDSIGPDGHLAADVEGLTLYTTATGSGYLIGSVQGKSRFVVYERAGDNSYVGAFTIGAGAGIDGVSGTDGIDVTSAALGPPFPMGVFVAQDDENDGQNQNFKLVPWDAIAQAFTPPLAIVPSDDHRRESDVTHPPEVAASLQITSTGTLLPAATAPATPVTLVLTAEADARVEAAHPDDNFGKEDELRADGGTDPRTETYLRFTLGDVEGSIEDARLWVFATSETSDPPALMLAQELWSETGITWTKRPGRTSRAVDDRPTIARNTWARYDVTSVVRMAGTYSLLLTTESGNGVSFAARETRTPPQLFVTLLPQPAPAVATPTVAGHREAEPRAESPRELPPSVRAPQMAKIVAVSSLVEILLPPILVVSIVLQLMALRLMVQVIRSL